MKLILEQDDIFQAVAEYLKRQGLLVPERVKYDLRQGEDESISLEIHGVTRAPVEVLPTPVAMAPQKRAARAVEEQPARRAFDPGPSPIPEVDDSGEPSFDALTEANQALTSRYVPARQRFTRMQEFPLDNMGKDPTNMDDEI